jgi:hypothetical protein
VEALGTTKSGSVVSIHLDSVRKTGRWSCEIIGSKASLTWDSETKILVVKGETEHEEKIVTAWNDMFVAEVKFFLSLLSQEKKFSNIDEAARDAVAIDRIKMYGR